MTGVAASDNDGLLARPSVGSLVLGRVHHGALEGVHAWPVWQSGLAREASGEDDVVDLHLPWLLTGLDDGSVPLLGLLVVLGAALDGSLGPVIELHGVCVVLEPARELVLGREHRPVWGVRDVREVVGVDWVVQDKVVVALRGDERQCQADS